MSPVSMQRVETTVRAVLSLLDALNRGAFEQASERITQDCVLITPEPAPVGRRYVGREAVLHYLRTLCALFHFKVEDTINLGLRGVVCFRLVKHESESTQEPLAGVMLLSIRAGAVNEIDFYVKGPLD